MQSMHRCKWTTQSSIWTHTSVYPLTFCLFKDIRAICQNNKNSNLPVRIKYVTCCHSWIPIFYCWFVEFLRLFQTIQIFHLNKCINNTIYDISYLQVKVLKVGFSLRMSLQYQTCKHPLWTMALPKCISTCKYIFRLYIFEIIKLLLSIYFYVRSILMLLGNAL